MIRKFGLTLLCMLLTASALAQSSRPPFLPIWAVTAVPTNDILQPNNTFISLGWPLSSTPPSRQYFNWVLNRSTWGVDYILHRGIADWDSSTVYGSNDLAIGSNGRLYRSTQPSNTGNSPPNSSFWNVPAIDTLPTGDNSPSIANTAFVTANFVPRGGAFSLLGGQIGSSQVPFSAVQQYQASLSIGFGQITGVPLNTGTVISPLTILERDTAGDAFARYFNSQAPNNESLTVSQVMVTNGSDNYLRKANLFNFAAQIPLSNLSGQVTAGQVPASAVTQYSPQLFAFNPLQSKTNPGCAQLPGGVIIMWGPMTPNNNTITVAFPCGGFPNAALSVVGNGSSVPTQTNVISWNNTTFQVHNTGGAGNYIAIGF